MERRLPPLNGLRAFEAAARLLSFTRAAAELNVTPGAVSRQIIGTTVIGGMVAASFLGIFLVPDRKSVV